MVITWYSSWTNLAYVHLAIVAMGCSKRKEAIATIRETAFNSYSAVTDIEEVSCRALRKIGGEQAKTALRDFMRTSSFVRKDEAFEALASLRDPMAVALAIGALGTEPDGWNGRLVQALEKETGQHFGCDIAQWRKWFVTQSSSP
jgi:hypothetical protein